MLQIKQRFRLVLVIEHMRHVLITVIDYCAEPPFISTEMMIFIIEATVFVFDHVHKHEVEVMFYCEGK